MVRVCSGFLFRSPNWHPSLQDGYVRDKLMHINMQIHLMGVQSLAQCNFSFLSLLWFSSTRNLPSTEHLESSKQILRFPNSLGRFVSKFKPIFHLQLPFPTKKSIAFFKTSCHFLGYLPCLTNRQIGKQTISQTEFKQLFKLIRLNQSN